MKKTGCVRISSFIMKVSFIYTLLTFTCTAVLFAHETSGQGILDRKISVSVDNEPFKAGLKKIARAASIKFSYTRNTIPENEKISLSVNEEAIGEIFNALFAPYNIRFEVVGRQVILISVKREVAGNAFTATADKDPGFAPVTGSVTDSLGNPMVGISVLVEGKSRSGTTTDQNGRFVIDALPQDVLVFSAVGYEDIRVPVGNKTVVNVVMKPSVNNLVDVVITAFGKKQRKEAIVGSVTSVNVKELKVASSNLTTAFAGRMAGVIAYQRSGEPGADNAAFFIRGVTTFGKGSGNPLILIDNIELTTTDLARLQPDDIESFSVLKDASATALYGARGANGVIFVTTKQGKEGKTKFNIRLENSISSPTKKIKIADAVTHMQLYTEAQLTRDPLAQLLYNQNKIDHTIAGDNPAVYPTTDWFKMMFKDRTGNQRANVSLTGGGRVARYYVAGTYNIDHGILNVDGHNNFNSNVKLNSYQLRTNVNIRLTPSTELVTRMFGIFDDYKGPIDGGANLYIKALRSSPALFAPFYAPDSANAAAQHILFGNYRSGDLYYMNPYADMLRGYKEYSRSRMLAQFEINQNLSAITSGLSLRAMFSTNRYSYFDISRAYGPYYYNVSLYDKATGKYNLAWLNEKEPAGSDNAPYEDIRGLFGDRNSSTNLYAQGTLDYSHVFNDKHTVGGTLVYTMQQTLATTTSSFDAQSTLPHRNTGLSGRASYSYDSRYFFEFNFGYNGSERFYKDKQFGFFPTIGLGWMVSNEKFWNISFINRLKLRGSYGLVGNDAIGSGIDRFFYLSSVNLEDGGRGASFGFDNGYSRNGVSISRYPNKDITWERSYQQNLALELGLLNKWNIIAEIYSQKRTNILQPRSSIPSTMGLARETQANVGEARSKGLDLSADFTENFSSNAWVTLRGSFTYARGEFTKYEEPAYADKYLSRVGQSLAQNWGLVAERLFIDDKDVLNSPKQNFGLYQAGDIKFRDINGDGQITSSDMVPVGNSVTPEITYGFGFSAGYKKFDLSIFMQGLARESFWIDAAATAPFNNYNGDGINGGRIGENALLQAYADSHWSEENRNIYAIWPRLSVTPINNNEQTSTWFMRDGSFLRVKTIEAGYTLPKKLLDRCKISNLRIYASGVNLFTFSRFKLWDPEMGGNGLGYPVQKVINFGINLNF